MSHHEEKNPVHGVMAKFSNSDVLIAAAEKVRDEGYTATDAYSPVPVHGLFEAIGGKRSLLPYMVLAGGLIGGFSGFAMQTWINVEAYPLNVGGRPFFSWPSFIPVTFECTILGAALTAVFGMFGLNKLPEPFHPVFNASDFHEATNDKYFLIIEASDEKFDEGEVTRLLEGLNPDKVETVMA